ncbi:MAG TPA: hypothetical protein VEA40_11290 [Ramlibacter sp.]|nr:hypothetical protein [Ramlibacter sp.]
MDAKLTILHPGIEGDAAAEPRLARRLASLKGARIALLDNGKVNAGVILAAVAERLQKLGAGESRAWKKQHASYAGEKEIPQIKAWQPDLALVGIGD